MHRKTRVRLTFAKGTKAGTARSLNRPVTRQGLASKVRITLTAGSRRAGTETGSIFPRHVWGTGGAGSAAGRAGKSPAPNGSDHQPRQNPLSHNGSARGPLRAAWSRFDSGEGNCGAPTRPCGDVVLVTGDHANMALTRAQGCTPARRKRCERASPRCSSVGTSVAPKAKVAGSSPVSARNTRGGYAPERGQQPCRSTGSTSVAQTAKRSRRRRAVWSGVVNAGFESSPGREQIPVAQLVRAANS